MNSLVSPPRNGSRLPGPQVAYDHRSNLPRRFTTDSGRIPTLNSMASLASPPQGPEQPQDYNVSRHPPSDLPLCCYLPPVAPLRWSRLRRSAG